MITKLLFEKKDESYKNFLLSIIKDLEEKEVIGVRKKDLREIFKKTKDLHKEFLNTPHIYQEEFLIHIYIISEIDDFKEAIFELDKIIDKLDNWELTDSVKIKNMKNEENLSYSYFENLISSGKTFYIRTALVLMMRYFNSPFYLDKNLNLIFSITNYDYYVKMGVGWFLEEFTKKYKSEGYKILEDRKLAKEFQNAFISKIRQSSYFTKEEKEIASKYKI